MAVAFADAFDASGWAISLLPAGDHTVSTVYEGGRRAHRVSGVPSLRFMGTNDAYRVDEYPATAAIMARGGTFAVSADDPAGDPAEQALLRHAGHHGLVGRRERARGRRLAAGALLGRAARVRSRA